jgi:hypothetical protein
MRTNEYKDMFLVYDSLKFFGQIGLHQLNLEEYTNDDGIHINYNASIRFVS